MARGEGRRRAGTDGRTRGDMERPASAGGATPTPPKRRRRPATAEPRVFLPAIQSPGARRLSFPSPATTWNDLTKEVVAEKLGEQTEKERGGQVRRPSLDETKRTPAPASEQAVDGNVELDVTAWTQTVDTVHDDAAAGDGQTALGHLRQQLSTAEVHASVRWLLLAFLCAALSTSLGYGACSFVARRRDVGPAVVSSHHMHTHAIPQNNKRPACGLQSRAAEAATRQSTATSSRGWGTARELELSHSRGPHLLSG